VPGNSAAKSNPNALEGSNRKSVWAGEKGEWGTMSGRQFGVALGLDGPSAKKKTVKGILTIQRWIGIIVSSGKKSSRSAAITAEKEKRAEKM